MKIGFDLSVLRQRRTGIGNYAFNLSERLKKLETNHELIFLDGPNSSVPFWSRHVSYPREIRKQGIDILHGPANVLPLFYKGKSVITVHDLAIYKHPEWFPGNQWFATKIVVPRSIKKADKIIVPSEVTKRDLMELFSVPEGKIAVIPLGVGERFFRQSVIARSPAGDEAISLGLPREYPRNDEDKKYILFVGTLEPRKNLQRVVEAYSGLPVEIKDEFELWIAGGKGWGEKKVRHSEGNPEESQRSFRLRQGYGGQVEVPQDDRVKWLDYVSYEDLPGLYQNASLFVYPSLYEGFGLPVLEAMAAGTPAIVSETIAGNFQFPISNFQSISKTQFSNYPFAVVDPYSVEEIREVMVKILTNPTLAARMSGAGIAYAKHFTWNETARKTLEVYEIID